MPTNVASRSRPPVEIAEAVVPPPLPRGRLTEWFRRPRLIHCRACYHLRATNSVACPKCGEFDYTAVAGGLIKLSLFLSVLSVGLLMVLSLLLAVVHLISPGAAQFLLWLLSR